MFVIIWAANAQTTPNTTAKQRLVAIRIANAKKKALKLKATVQTWSTYTWNNSVLSWLKTAGINPCTVKFPVFTWVYNTGWMSNNYSWSYSWFYREAVNRTATIAVTKYNLPQWELCWMLEQSLSTEYDRYRSERDRLWTLFASELSNERDALSTILDSFTLDNKRLTNEYNVCLYKNEMSAQDYILWKVANMVKLNCWDMPIKVIKSLQDDIARIEKIIKWLYR